LELLGLDANEWAEKISVMYVRMADVGIYMQRMKD
jgi:hypothetical protein